MHRIIVIGISALTGAVVGYFGPRLAGYFRRETPTTLPFPALRPYPRGKKGRTADLTAPSNNAVYPDDGANA